MSSEIQPSFQTLSESFAAADERFLDSLEKTRSTETLTSLLQLWLADQRAWAQQQLVNYLQRDLNFAGHEVVIKGLMRHSESARDHTMMARLMVTLDRLVRRSRLAASAQSLESPGSREIPRLLAKPNRTVVDQSGRTRVVGAGQWKRTIPLPDLRNRPENRLFRHRTRNYLRRRVWRYFRWLSFRDPHAYLKAISSALVQYRDSDLKLPEQILDNWSLMHACYFHSDVLRFGIAHANLAPGRSLEELQAAPWNPILWHSAEAIDLLLQIVDEAESSLARNWAIDLLQQNHAEAIPDLPIHRLMKMVLHRDSRARQLALPYFLRHSDVGQLDVVAWLDLLETSDRSLQHELGTAMTAHVLTSDLDTAELLQMTIAEPLPVAESGFQQLRQRQSQHPLSIEELTTLSRAKCEALAAELTSWALTRLGTQAPSCADSMARFFEAPMESLRAAAVHWLEHSESPGRTDPALWSILVETSCDDVRLRVLKWLDDQTRKPAEDVESMIHVWCSVVLSANQKSRAKRNAITRIQSAILSSPDLAPSLLPILGVAVRSLRVTERRQALSGIAALMVNGDLSLREHVEKLIPEICLVEQPNGEVSQP